MSDSFIYKFINIYDIITGSDFTFSELNFLNFFFKNILISTLLHHLQVFENNKKMILSRLSHLANFECFFFIKQRHYFV